MEAIPSKVIFERALGAQNGSLFTRFLGILLFIVCGLSPASFAQRLASKKETLRHVDKTLAAVSSFREQAKPTKFKVDVISKESMKKYVHKILVEKVSKDVLLMDSWSAVALKLMSRPVDSIELAKAFAGDNAAGFYDPAKKSLFLIEWVSPAQLIPVLAHELTHLLQDEKIDLEKFIKVDFEKERKIPYFPADRAQAHHALVEGEAVLMMALVIEKAQGMPGRITGSDDVSFFLGQVKTQVASISKQLKIPEVLVYSALFSYQYGYAFARALWKKGGFKLLKNAYDCAPKSTHEIMNPDLYLLRFQTCSKKDKPDKNLEFPENQKLVSSLEALIKEKKARVFSTEMGYLGTRLFVQHHQPMNAQPHWLKDYKNDRIIYILTPFQPKRAGFIWDIQWRHALSAKLAFADFSFMTRSALGSAVNPHRPIFFKETETTGEVLYSNKQEKTDHLVLRQGKNIHVLWNLDPKLVENLKQIIAGN